MLPTLTFTADLFEMAASLWLAFYLLARGYPNRVTMRIVLALLALSAFFLSAYYNFFFQVIGSASQRAALLIIATGCWYSTTFQLLPRDQRTRLRWMEIGVYLLCATAAILLLANPDEFVG